MKISIDDADTVQKINNIRLIADKTVEDVFIRAAEDAEITAKKNAPWTDRTGNARRTLTGKTVLKVFGEKRLYLIGKMDYSVRLELFYDFRFSILFPTILEKHREILDNVAAALEEVAV